MLLTGDLPFVGDIGRPDLPGAEILDEQVENLYQSLYVKLAGYPDSFQKFFSHPTNQPSRQRNTNTSVRSWEDQRGEDYRM